MPCFCTTPEEDLDDTRKNIREMMKKMIREMKSIRVRGFDPELILKESHELMDHLFYGRCDGNGYPIDDHLLHRR